MDINLIVEEAMDTISEYCLNECDADCCKRSYLRIEKDEIGLFIKDGKELAVEVKGQIRVPITPCPNLKDNKCSIYKDRPYMCRHYPIRFVDNIVKINLTCRGIRNGIIDKYIDKINKEKNGHTELV